MSLPGQADPVAGQRYLLLADISGYTAFLNGVEREHGVDFSPGIPAGYEVLGAILDAVVDAVQPPSLFGPFRPKTRACAS